MAPLDAQYARLSPTDDDVQVESKIALCECASMDQYRPKRSYGLTLLCANIIICATTLCALGWILALQKSPEDVDSAKMISAYYPQWMAADLSCLQAPLWDAVEYWEGNVINYFNHSTIYRGPPTLEREQAWDALWNHPGFGVSAAGLKALNKTHEGPFLQLPGSDAQKPVYGAIVEGFHQLHCLNVVRQATWSPNMFSKSWGALYPPQISDNPVRTRMHIDHCIEALRLALMCYADITPMLIKVDEGRRAGGFLDFDMHRKCRNFEKIVEHIETVGVDLPPPWDQP